MLTYSEVIQSCLPTCPRHSTEASKPVCWLCSVKLEKNKIKIGTTGPFPGTFTGSVELSYTPTITILCRSLFLNLLAVYLAISSSPVILFCPLCLSTHLYFSHIPTQHYTFKSFEDNRQPSSVSSAKWMLKAYKVSLQDAAFHCSVCAVQCVGEAICPGSVMWCSLLL